MSITAAPLSSVKKIEYERKMEAEKKKQEQAFAVRVMENAKYADQATAKILNKIKEMKEEEAKKLSNPDEFYVPAEPNFIVAVQVRSQNKISPKVRKVLELLRLTSINSCVIIRNNESMKKMLQIAKDTIGFGFVDYEVLRTLLYKRGFGRIGRSKVALTNENIEQVFNGKYRCIEELAYVIYTGGEDIKQVLNFLYPFKLSAPAGGFRGRKALDYLQGGATNNHKELLCNLLTRMI